VAQSQKAFSNSRRAAAGWDHDLTTDRTEADAVGENRKTLGRKVRLTRIEASSACFRRSADGWSEELGSSEEEAGASVCPMPRHYMISRMQGFAMKSCFEILVVCCSDRRRRVVGAYQILAVARQKGPALWQSGIQREAGRHSVLAGEAPPSADGRSSVGVGHRARFETWDGCARMSAVCSSAWLSGGTGPSRRRDARAEIDPHHQQGATSTAGSQEGARRGDVDNSKGRY